MKPAVFGSVFIMTAVPTTPKVHRHPETGDIGVSDEGWPTMQTIDIVFWSALILGLVYMGFSLLTGAVSQAIHGVSGHVHLHLDAGDAAAHLHTGGEGAGVHGSTLHGDAVHAEAHGGHAEGHLHGDHAHGEHPHGEAGNHHGSTPAWAVALRGLLNPLSLTGFCLGFGASGVVMRLLHSGPLSSLAAAVPVGLGFWWISDNLVVKMFARAEGTSHNRRDHLVGLTAKVTAPIADGRPGMVAYTVAGSRQSLTAVCESEEPLPIGASVRIRSVRSNTAVVVPIEQDAQPLRLFRE